MAKKCAVFDIDGTLYRGTFFLQCVQLLIEQGVIPKDLQAQADVYHRAWQEREHPEAYRAFSRYLVETWETHQASIPVQALETVARQLVADNKHRVYCYTRDLAHKLKAEGYTLIAISGSFHEAVEPFAKHYGFDIIVGEQNQRHGQQFDGTIMQPTHTDKHLILQKLLNTHDLTLDDSYGIGDSHGDISLLGMVDHPIAFNPNKVLYEAAKKHGWPIVIERKDVIYQLEPTDHGSYVLA